MVRRKVLFVFGLRAFYKYTLSRIMKFAMPLFLFGDAINSERNERHFIAASQHLWFSLLLEIFRFPQTQTVPNLRPWLKDQVSVNKH